MSHRSLENSIRDIMAASSQPAPVEEVVEEGVETEEKQLDEAMSPEAKAAKKHIEDLAKKHNKSFGDMRMHIDDFPGKHDRKTQAAAKALNKHQYGEEVEQVDEVDKGFGQRMKAADAAANIYSKEKRKPDNREIDKIRAKYRAQKNNQSQSEEAEKVEEQNCGCGQNPCKTYGKVDEKTLTPAEKKKREEVAKAIERDNPKMPMDKKMAIATATAKKVAEERMPGLMQRVIDKDK